MTTFGATAELSVPDSEIERARREIEDELEVEVSVNTDTTTPTSSPGGSRGGLVATLLEEQTDLLADIHDAIDDAGGFGRGGGGSGGGVVPAVGAGAGSGGILSVPDSEIERARREIEDGLEVEVSVNTDTTTPTSSPGGSRGGLVATLLEEQTDLLADILDAIDDAGGFGRGGGGSGGGVVPAVGAGAGSGGLLSALSLGGAAVAGTGVGLGAVNLLDRTGAFDATEGAGEQVGNALGPFRDATAGGLARGFAPLGLAGAAAPGLSRGNIDRAESDVRAYGRTALQPPTPDQTILGLLGGSGETGTSVSPQALMNLGQTGVSAGEAVSSGELINDQTISRLESLELVSDEQIQQLKSATSGPAGPDPNDEGALARVGTAQRQAGATTISGGETPSRIAARAAGASSSQSQLSGQQQQAIEANVTVDESIQIDANIDDLEREIDSQLGQKLDKMKRDLMSELRRRFA